MNDDWLMLGLPTEYARGQSPHSHNSASSTTTGSLFDPGFNMDSDKDVESYKSDERLRQYPLLEDPVYFADHELLSITIQSIPNILGAYVSRVLAASLTPMDTWLCCFHKLTVCAVNQAEEVRGKCMYISNEPRDLIFALLLLCVAEPGQVRGLIISPDKIELRTGRFVIDSRDCSGPLYNTNPLSTGKGDNEDTVTNCGYEDYHWSISYIHWELLMRNADHFFEDVFVQKHPKMSAEQIRDFKDQQVVLLHDNLFKYLVDAALWNVL